MACKNLPLVLLVSVLIGQILCQDIRWGWIQGPPTADSASTDTEPGGRSGTAYWMQPDGKAMLMFGGETHDDPGLLNDLWRLDLASHTWSLMHNGSAASVDEVPAGRQLGAACGVQDLYFVLFGGLGQKEQALGDTWIFHIPDKSWYTLEAFRIKMHASNETLGGMPSPRGDMAVWCNNKKDLVLFGGINNDLTVEHDLWRFNLDELSWTQSESSSKLPAAPEFVQHLDYPAGRSGATTWRSKGNLYMFGGNIQQSNPRSHHLNIGNTNDMWMYNVLEDSWIFITGLKTSCQRGGNYGELGLMSYENQPGCRRKAAGWVDHHQNLWMFGGDGVDSESSSLSVFSHSKLLSDVWHFDTDKYQWTWKGGHHLGDQKGSHGDKGEMDNSYLPGSRCEMVVWGTDDNFYLYGGVGHDGNGKDGYLNDIWKLDVHLDSSVGRNAPQKGTVAGLIVLGLGLVIFLVIIYTVSRGNWARGKNSHRYAPLAREINENS